MQMHDDPSAARAATVDVTITHGPEVGEDQIRAAVRAGVRELEEALHRVGEETAVVLLRLVRGEPGFEARGLLVSPARDRDVQVRAAELSAAVRHVFRDFVEVVRQR